MQATSIQSTPSAANPKRSVPFMVVLSLFGLGLGFTLNILDPYIYSDRIRYLVPAALKNTTLSFITIAALGVAFVVQPLIGQWSDRTHGFLGRRMPYFIAGVVGLSAALILVVTADSLWLLIGAALLVSTSTNTIQGPWQALIPDQVPEQQHGLAAGIKTLLEALGAAAGVALVGFALSRGNLWTTPAVALSLFWVFLLLTWLTLRTSLARYHPVQVIQAINPVPALVRNLQQLPAGFPWWMLNRFLFWAAAISIRTFLLNFMEDVLAMSPGQAQALASQLSLLLGAGVLLLVLPSGILADRVGRRPLLVLAGLVAAGGATMFVFLPELPFLFVAGSLIAIGAGIFSSASWSLATTIAPKSESALCLGLANAASVLGSATGRLGGPLIDGLNQLSHTTSLGYLAVFGLAALFFVGSSVVVWKIPDKL